jgi:hypothetical protein
MEILTFSKLGEYGRLGNQLFEIASLLGLSDRYDVITIIPENWKYRNYFNIPNDLYKESEVYDAQVIENKFHYLSDLLENVKGDVIDVVGTLQSEKYWINIKDDIKQWLMPKDVIQLEDNSVGIHWRLGDYLGNQAYVQYGANYYLSAINKYFKEGYKFYVVSDNIEHCKKHFIGDQFIFKGGSEIEDLKTLIGCKHHILSASTFSWWGAYLSDSKLVIRPPKIFAGTLKNNYEGDFWQDEWICHSDFKTDLKDVTFIIPVKYDSIDRKENLKITIDFLQSNFDTNIIIGEQGGEYFKSVEGVSYISFPYKEFHRTKMLNRMTKLSNTPIVINWDTDILLSPFQVYKMAEKLRGVSDFVYPYDGRFLRVGDGTYGRNKELIEKAKIGDVGIFAGYDFIGETDSSVGGVIGFKKQSFIHAGMENENFIAYTPEDVERYYRFTTLGYKVDRVEGALYHLNHHCSATSNTQNPFYRYGVLELARIKKMNRLEIYKYMDAWEWTKEPKIVFITYANEAFKPMQDRLIKVAKQSGSFDEIFTFTEEWLHKTEFYKENKHILDQPKGVGYCLWKPYIILETLKKLQEGDILFYLDSADMINGDIRSFLLERMKDKNIILTDGSFKNSEWTHKECFELMGCDISYWNTTQLEAGIFVCKKNKEVTSLIIEWLEYCEDENILTENNHNQLSSFKEHRYDQSVLTNLKVKYNLYSSNEMRQFVRCNVPEQKELKGVSYIIPVFYDSKDRLRNLNVVTKYIRSIRGEIIIGEQGGNKFKSCDYDRYIEFNYQEFHRTKMLNEMVKQCDSDIVVICDSDVIVPYEQIYNAIELISNNEYDVVYPHNKFVKLDDKNTKHFIDDMNFKYMDGERSHGGMILFNKKSYLDSGGENENFISWGLEDIEFVNRLKKLNFRLKRLDGCLYHLNHYRGENSSTIHPFYQKNVYEYKKVSAMSPDQIRSYVKSWKN